MRIAGADRPTDREFVIRGLARAALFACLAAGALTDCQPAAPPVGSSAGSSETDVETALIRFSTALASADTAALRDLTTPEFALLDEGHTHDRASLVAAILPVLATGRMDRVPLDFHTTTRGDAAWSHYRVGGMFATANDTMRLDLLETAVLVRDSTWRVALASTQPAARP